MKGGTVIIIFLLLAATALAVPSPLTHNGKEYYKVDATIPDEDSGAEVCGKLGLVCLGFTEPTTSVCKLYNPTASEESGLSGDASGVYCNGAPQGGVCSTSSNTCIECPSCTRGLDCNSEIGSLYREAYVECAPQPPPPSGCPVVLYARNTQQLLGEISALDARIKNCPTMLPSPADKLLSNGNVQVDILMQNGNTETFSISVAGDKVTGISKGSTGCKQKITMSESDLDDILGSKSRGAALTAAYGQGKLKSSGCTVVRKIFTFFSSPITRFVARQATPPPPPASTCAPVGGSCNQNGCARGGICASPNEYINGRWQHANWRCIPESQYNALCVGRGNSRPAWDCLTSSYC